MPPTFTSFDDAWRWFVAGGVLEPLVERRERFTAGRAQFLGVQVPINETDALDAVLDVQDQLADLAGLVLAPANLLHISVRGVGFQVIARTRPDEVLPADVPRIADRAARVLRATRPISARIGPINVFPDAVILEVHDGGALADIRGRLDLLERDDAFGYAAGEYLPHITLASFDDVSVAAALRERLPALRDLPPAPVTIKRIELARWWFTGIDDAGELDRDTVRSYLLRD